ncbi:YagE family protein [Cardiosporidium cionae]|uniref:YagE family protein n=1 Tax=Cardiosporidium cionae TaxID=476202 RepID=A0ABQ7J4U3_9APIC|nr:YagE family protein [Cardiosporidium cionae]|eukprot:KAF8818752.1 YagE family protein [Cardiosporidium cionae]
MSTLAVSTNMSSGERYVYFDDVPKTSQTHETTNVSDQGSLSDAVDIRQRKTSRVGRKRADIKVLFGIRKRDFTSLAASVRSGEINALNLRIDSSYSEVLFCSVFPSGKNCFLFKYGCLVLWDFSRDEQNVLLDWLKPHLLEPLLGKHIEFDDMEYVHTESGKIKADVIQLSSTDSFEQLAYSYAFAQSVKLSVFEAVVDSTIAKTKYHPDDLAKTGIIKLNRQDVCRKIGELFVNRFYINLQTDILDTPDILWEHDEFVDQYEMCRRYLEIPKRVVILNQR